MAHLALHCCDGPRWTWGDEFVRDTQAMVPEPNNNPKRDDQGDEEPDDEPDPGTLYFGEDDGWKGQFC